MEIVLLIPVILSFFLTLIGMPFWITRAKIAGLEGRDMNKYSKPIVAEAGGIIAIGGFILGVLAYVAIKTFFLGTDIITIEIFSLISAILIISLIGMVDSLLAASSRLSPNPDSPGFRKGLRKRYRMLLCLFAAIPLMVINAGQSEIALPFIGSINVGLLFPLLIIPLGFLGATTTFNFLAGYNGLEAGQGILMIGALSIVAFFTGNSWLALIGACMIAALAAFLFFNRFPAKVFPGDILTYPLGALIACMAILGNFERIALFFFIPYIAETILKIRGKLKKQSYGKPNKDNSLEMPYDKIYGLEHLAIKILKIFKEKVYERDVVRFIHGLQIAVILLGFFIFKSHIF